VYIKALYDYFKDDLGEAQLGVFHAISTPRYGRDSSV
jgi:hypothetical protein